MRHNIRWIILAILIAASFISYVLRTNVSIVAADMSEDLGLTELQLGMVFSAFAAGYAIFQIPGGILGAKYGPRLVIALMAVCWGILTVLTALVPGPEILPVTVILGSLIVLRFLVGAVHAPLFPCVGCGSIANWFPQGGWGVPNGLTSTGLTLGAAATAPILVWMLDLMDWRGALLVTAPSAFMIAGVWWWYVRDYPKDHKSVTEKELALIDQGREDSDEEYEPGSWKPVLMNRDILLLTLSYFCMNYIFYLFFSWFFYYLTKIKGVGAAEAGFMTAALWILGAVGATAGGVICDLLIKRFGLRWGPAILCITGLTACGAFLLGGAFATNAYLAVAFFCLSFGFTQVTEAAFWSTAISVGGRYASVAGGVMNTGANIPGFIGGMMVPAIAAVFGWTTAIATGAIFAFVGAAVWLYIRGDNPMKIHDQVEA